MSETYVAGLERRLNHLPFIEELAALGDGDPAAPATRAGLLALRFVDAWVEDRAVAATGESRVARSVRASIEQISPGVATRSILLNVLEAMIDPGEADGKSVWQCLITYGRALDLDARWKLAVDVYDTLLEHVRLEEDSESVINALLRRGFCLRELGSFAEAEANYDVATEQARRCGDARGTLRAQIGRVHIAFARGNFPLADAILEETIRVADVHSLADVRALANHDRSVVALYRGEYDVAIRYGYAALRETAAENIERDRILNNLAVAFVLLGMRSAARDAFLILAATAREQQQRWVSTINLMELAATDGSRLQFERYQEQLVGAELPPHLRVEFELHVGRGYQRLNDFDLAREWLERALQRASAHSLNRLVFAAEAALATNTVVPGDQLFAPSIPVVVAVDIEQIAEDLRALRELALSLNE